jgi:ABC-type amino acid transport substrate-binding protein
LALDVADEALRRAGVNARTTVVEEEGLRSALLKGEFEGSVALWKDVQWEQTFLYSQPYLENRLILVGPVGRNVSARTLEALSGKKIALVESDLYRDAVWNRSGPAFIPSLSEEDSLRKVLDGEVSYTLMDAVVVEYILNNYPEEAHKRLAFGTAPLLARTLHFAVRRDLPYAVSVINRFDAELEGMVRDWTYHRLLHVEWLQADVDRNGLSEYVPRNDQAGPEAPKRVYKLLSITRPAEAFNSPPHFFVGGNFYPNWSRIPETFRAPPPGSASSRAESPLFRFTW